MEWRLILVFLCAVAYTAAAVPMEQEDEMELNDFEMEDMPSDEGEDSVDEVSEDIYKPPVGVWKPWSSWSKCSRPCGPGKQYRRRTCLHQYPYVPCKGDSVQKRPCNNGPCPIDGGWSSWSSWSACSAPCDGGVQTKTRTCTNPAPQHGGKDCRGPAKAVRKCNTRPCPVDGGWSEWSRYGRCSVTCGGGSQKRYRTCTNPAPMYGGKDCKGDSLETRKCNTQPCPIDGEWGSWSSWSECSAPCNGGHQSRTRKCDSPAPQHGGRDCHGPSKQLRKCNLHPCPVDGGWSEWSSYGGCSASCGGGVQSRYRKCSNPAPMYGGEDCEGPAKQTRTCNNQPCPIDGEWSEWGAWSECSRTCGSGGTRSRKRTCTDPAPKYGGEDCPGKSKQIIKCPIPYVPCCVDKWSAYKCQYVKKTYCSRKLGAYNCKKTCNLCH